MSVAGFLPRLGFGVTGPHASGFTTPDQTALLIRQAIVRGVTLFDTGPMYGDGEGERRLGRAIVDAPREDLFLITKARTHAPDGSRQSLVGSLERSLERMGVSYVDALLLHGPAPDEVDDPAVLMDLQTMMARGLARQVGVCGRGAERAAMLRLTARRELFSILMSPLDDLKMLEQAQTLGVSVVAIETMRSHKTAYRFPVSLADCWYLARALRDAAQSRRQGKAVGVGAALQLPGVTSVIVTTTRLSHLEKNIATAF